jgi:tRNA (mo5U34)-methyltransferase
VVQSGAAKALQDEIDALRWFHQIDFGNGVLSPGWIKKSKVERVTRTLFTMPLAGKSVLDIGCWDGAYSLAAARLGASRVLATDHFAWSDRCWGDRRAFELMRTHLAPSIEVMDIDLPDLSVDRIGTFDIVLFLGVFYHLRHPLETLERVAALAGECLVLETHLMRTLTSKPVMRFLPRKELNGDDTNWWLPNRACVEAMLRDVGFTRITMKHPDYRRRRGIFHAWR